MSNSRKKRRVTRRADAELQEAERAFDGGLIPAAEKHYRSALQTMRELDESAWGGEDNIRVMKAYAGILLNMPEMVDAGAEDLGQEVLDNVHFSRIRVQNPELVVIADQAYGFLNTQPDIASLDYFIAKLDLLKHLAVQHLKGVAEHVTLEQTSGDPTFVSNYAGEVIQALDAMYVVLDGQDVELSLTEKQRKVLADTNQMLAYIYLRVLDYTRFIECFQKTLQLKLNSNSVDDDFFENTVVEVFDLFVETLPKYDIELREISLFASRAFSQEAQPFQEAATFKDFVDISQLLLRQQNTGMALAFQVFNIVLDIIHSRMQAGAFEQDSPEFFPDNEFKNAMCEPKCRQVFLETRKKFQSANALFQRMGRDPSILFSQELEIQRLRQANYELNQRLDLLEKRIMQSEPAQPSAGGMFKHSQVRERDSDKGVNPDECKRAKFSC